jgi:hypothetical protein
VLSGTGTLRSSEITVGVSMEDVPVVARSAFHISARLEGVFGLPPRSNSRSLVLGSQCDPCEHASHPFVSP